MENEKQILVVGRDECFGIAHALATSMGFTFTQPNQIESVKNGLILEIQATGYDFGVEPSDLAEYLIKKCDDFNFNNQRELSYIDFLNAYVSQHSQYIEDRRLSANRAAILINAGKMEVGKYEPDFEVATIFNNFGESVKQFILTAEKLKSESLEARRNGNQKWYNQFQNKRKRK